MDIARTTCDSPDDSFEHASAFVLEDPVRSDSAGQRALRRASVEGGRVGMATTATATEPVLLRTTQSRATHPNRRTSEATRIPVTNGRVASDAAADDIARIAEKVETVCVSADVALRVLGVGRTAGYKSINDGIFPVAIVRIGRIIRVPLIPLRRTLGIAADDSTKSDRLS